MPGAISEFLTNFVNVLKAILMYHVVLFNASRVTKVF